MVHPILAADIASERQRDLLREAQRQHLVQSVTSNRPSRAASLRASAATAILALRTRLVPGRRAAIQPTVLCACNID
jgi:hypothetical protein